MKLIFTLIIFLMISVMGCTVKYQLVSSTTQNTDSIPQDLLEKVRNLPSSLEIPYEDRMIRTHFHFFNNGDSTINYNPLDAPGIVAQLLESANNRMTKNDKMSLPVGNETFVRDTHIRYVLANHKGKTGIFYHYQDQPEYFIKKGKKANRYDRKMINKYVVTSDSVLNVFIMPYDPIQLASGEQKTERTAIALGNTIKLPGLYQSSRPIWEYAGIFNHEVGHVLGLRHSWHGSDGCDDTPPNDNCWNTTSTLPCDGPTSNNLMDHNAHQSAITPCQIARMQASIANPGQIASRIVQPHDCNNLETEYVIANAQKWSQPVDLYNDLIVKKDGILYLTSLLRVATGATIKIEKGGILILENATLYNSCGYKWKGIVRHRRGVFYTVGVSNVIKDIGPSLYAAHN